MSEQMRAEDIAQMLGWSLSETADRLVELEDAGLLQIQRQENGDVLFVPCEAWQRNLAVADLWARAELEHRGRADLVAEVDEALQRWADR